MNGYEAVKDAVSARQAAVYYGIKVTKEEWHAARFTEIGIQA